MPFAPLDPTKFPPAARRHALPIILIAASLVLSVTLAGSGVTVLGLPPFVLPLVPFLCFLTIMFTIQRRAYLFVKRVYVAKGRLCVYCTYDLSALKPKGTCPECGGPYDHHLNRAMWSNLHDLPPVPGQLPPQNP